MTIKSNFPSIRPSLNLDFANTRALDPRITFTRTTTAAYYDGKTVAKAEENLWIRSQEFDVVTWTKGDVTVTSNSTTAPDGTSTADTVTNTATTAGHVIHQGGVNIVSGLSYTISVFAKKNTNDFLQITTFGSGNPLGTGRANFNLSTGVVGTVDNGTSTITDFGNGWYRCTYTITASASGSVAGYFGIITTSTAARFESYLGVGTESVYLWGAQLEQRSAVTAYTPTTTQPITNYIPALQTAASGVARFDHNPITGESLGLLVEEQRTNLFVRSEEFDTLWAATRSSVTANTIVAPNGTLTGDKLIEDTTASNTHTVDQFLTVVTNTEYTFSCYVKAAERSYISLFAFHAVSGTNNTERVVFNLSTLAVVSQTTAANRNTITAVGNGWYRVSAVVKNQIDTGTNFSIQLADNTGATSYTGDGYSGVYIWGAQLEAGAFPTSYIPTVAATVTRNADAASMTGTNFSSWFNPQQGTMYGEFAIPFDSPQSIFPLIFTIDDGSNNNRISIQSRTLDDKVVGVARANATLQLECLSSPTISYGAAQKTIFGYALNNGALSLNGAAVTTDTSGILPFNLNIARIGNAEGGYNSYLNGTIKKLAFYPSRLADAQLQALTTV
jgi:hypothetical protein